MPERSSLEGAVPEITSDDVLAAVIEQAFDYRGDVTIALRDGRQQVGYLFNRRRDVVAPFIQLFPASGGEPVTVPYADIQGIAFTGRDTAAGNSYAAWLKRKQAGTGDLISSSEPPSPDA